MTLNYLRFDISKSEGGNELFVANCDETRD